MNKNKTEEYLKSYDSLKKELNSKLSAYRHGKQLRISIQVFFGMTAVAALTALLFLLSEKTPLQSEAIRIIASGIFWLSLSFAVGESIICFFKYFSHIECAVEIEKVTNKFNSLISSAADFLQSENRDKTSDLMKRLTIAEAADKLSYDDIRLGLKQYSRRKYVVSLLIPLIFLIVWHNMSTDEFNTGIKRLTHPFQSIEPWSNLTFKIDPQNKIIPVGEDIEISAVPSRSTKSPVLLQIFEPGMTKGKRVEMYRSSEASDRYVYILSSLQDTLEYKISCEKFKSPRYAITVRPRPEISNIEIAFNQPEYVSKEPLILPEGVVDSTILLGTEVKISVTADQHLKEARIKLLTGKEIQSENPLESKSKDIIFDEKYFKSEKRESNDRSFTGTFTPATDTAFLIMLKSEYGIENNKHVVYHIKTKSDESPKVDILKPAENIPFPTTRRVDITALAKDDYGVHTLVLNYLCGNRRDWIPMNLKPDYEPVKEFRAEFPWMLDTVAAMPGTKITYYLQAEDAKTPAPNVATTSFYFINMPSMHDLYRGEEEQHKNIAQKLTEYVKNQKMRKEALMKAYEQIKHEEKLDYETQKAIENALEEGKKQAKEADKMLEDLQKLENAMKNNPFTSYEALERMQKVNELFNEVLDKNTMKMMAELQEGLTKVQLNPEEIEKYQNAFKTEEYIKSLDRTIDLLSQVREMQKYESLAEAIQDLYNRQNYIASETNALYEKQSAGEELTSEEKSKLQDLTAQQNKIGSELAELQKQSEEMLKSAEKQDLSNQNPMNEDVKNIKDKLAEENYKENNKGIEQSMDQQQLAQAVQQQKKMLSFLKNLKKHASSMQNMMAASTQPQLDLSSYIFKALNISEAQEMLYSSVSEMPSRFLRGSMEEIEGIIESVSLKELLVKQSAMELQGKLEAMVKTSFSLDPKSIGAIKDTQSIFAQIVKNLEDRAMSDAWTGQKDIIRLFNKLAADLLKAQEQSPQSSGSAGMNAMRQFRDLTRRQLGLYQRMMKGMGFGAGTQHLKEMAMEQQYIRKSLEKLMQQEKRLGNRGDLSDIIGDMKDVETKILDPELQRKTAEKQKQIFDKMMQAQKALKNRDEENEERQATKSMELIVQDEGEHINNTGFDKKLLSEQYISDSKEAYPENYKDFIEDYYKALSIYGGSEE